MVGHSESGRATENVILELIELLRHDAAEWSPFAVIWDV
jgi:hypothetical protein